MAKRSASTPQADPFRDRLSKLRRRMRADGLDALLVSNPLDVGYLTGFMGGDSYLYLPAGSGGGAGSGKPTLVTDRRYEEEAATYSARVRVQMRSGTMTDAVAEVAAGHGPQAMGVQGDHLTVSQLGTLHAALKKQKIGKKAVKETDGLLAALRRNKDDSEIKLITKALGIQQDALEAVIPTIRAGEREIEICARLEYEMMTRGSSGPSFETIVAAKASSSMPHYRPGSVKTAQGKPLLIDWGAVWNGYHGDMTRTFTLGKWSAKMREIYTITNDAHDAAASALKPGMTGADADKVARDVIADAGYGDAFGHSLGHGVGLEVHEGPGLSSRMTKTKLVPGDVVTIEPGIYLPGEGGVRIEDIYLITERGSKNLCRLPRDLGWATL